MYRTPPNLHHGILKPPSLFVTKKKPLHMSDISKQVQAEHTLLSIFDFQHLRGRRHCALASTATALPGAKRLQRAQKAYLSRRSFSGDGSMPDCHGVSQRSRKPLFLSSNAFRVTKDASNLQSVDSVSLGGFMMIEAL